MITLVSHMWNYIYGSALDDAVWRYSPRYRPSITLVRM